MRRDAGQSAEISEAILEGARLRPQGDPTRYFTWDVDGGGAPVCTGSSALGVAYEAATGNVHHAEDRVYERLHELYGHALYTVKVPRPDQSGGLITQEEAIYELEKMGWSREDIARWISSDPERDLEN